MSLREQHRDFKRLVHEYLEELRRRAQDPDATDEMSLRPALDVLVNGLPKIFTREELQITLEPLRKSFGTPDYKLKTSEGYLIGYIEAEGLSDDLENLPSDAQEQIDRFQSAGLRFVLTNHLHFVLYDYSSDGKTIVRADSVTLLNKRVLHKEPDPADIEALYRLFDRFLKEARPDINTPEELAERLAASARHIRDLLLEAYRSEEESGDLHSLKAVFEQTLIPDLTPEQFADMYAQTLAYGLFAARVNHRGPELLTLDNAWHDIPKTNPFLRKLFESVTGSALEEKPYRWVIEDLVHLLNALDMSAILEGFGRRTAQEDPIVHFYEDFLAEYDPELREKRGVYYTPEPVVSYIIRSLDYLLKEKFGLPEGLADHSKITYTVKHNDEESKEESHKVLILDPACGTGTFLYFVIDLIRHYFMERNEAGMWQGYVRQHLLPRIFGFELLMAPYAMAHLKLGMQLAGLDLSEAQREQWGYKFEGNERLGVYLTNTLEEPRPMNIPLLDPLLRMISEEANAATRVKRDLPILVVLGNPPYSGHSANKGPWIDGLLKGQLPDGTGVPSYYDVDGQPLGERNPKWLQDDYVKFIRWAQWRIEKTGAGILAFITNHGYLDNPTFRGMREKLLKTFSAIYLLNLHGNAKKRERVPEAVQRALGIGEQDENVFDIQQGVAIGLFVKEQEKSGPAKVYYADLWGLRERKYQWLLEHEVSNTEWQELSPQTPFYLLVPQERDVLAEYESGWKITEIMAVNSVGIVTARDHLTIQWSPREIWEVVQDFSQLDPEKAREKYSLGRDVRDWKVHLAQEDLRNSGPTQTRIVPILYRPFDTRFTYYTGRSRGFLCMPRPEVMRHMLVGKNLALITSRLTKGETFKHTQVTRNIVEVICMSPKTSNNGFVFPLYLYPTESEIQGGVTERKANLNPEFIQDVAEFLRLRFIPDGRGDLEETFGPEDVFHYIYAVLHSPTYRERYKEFLKIDFPRIPITNNLDLFQLLCQQGADLVALHLMEPDYEAASWNRDRSKPNPFHNINVRYPVPGDDVVERGYPKYFAPGEQVPGETEPLKEGRVYINPNKPRKGKKGQYFEGVPPEVWAFHVGGYQVCEKWLKDRRGRKLSYEDKEHYKKIVMALGETIRLMREIDEVIEHNGGWPIQ